MDLNARNFQFLAEPFDSNRQNYLQTGTIIATVDNRQTLKFLMYYPGSVIHLMERERLNMRELDRRLIVCVIRTVNDCGQQPR